MIPRIGLRTTGLVVFGARILSAVTGLVFAVMIGRWLPRSQYGLYEYVVTLVSFAIYSVGLVGFWATRDVARGKMIGKTAYVLGFLLSLSGLGVYAGFTYFTHSAVSTTLAPFLVGAVLVPLSFWNGITGALVLGYRPVAGAYALVCGEIAKVLIGYTELYVLKAGLVGVLLALSATNAVQAMVGTLLTRGAAQGKLNWEEGKRWLKLWQLPALTSFAGVLLLSDTAFVALLFGTTLAGTYQPAYQVASVVGYASALTTPLYPLLLRGSGSGDKTSAMSLEFMLLFAIPMAVGAIVLAQPILLLFGPTYTVGSAGLQILCLMFLFLSISGVMDQTLWGKERADIDEGTNIRRLAGSNLVFVPAVNIAFAATYIASMVLVVSYATTLGMSDSVRVALWATMQLIAVIVYVVVKAVRVRRIESLVPGRSVITYVVASGVMAAVLYLLAPFVNASADATRYGAELAGVVLTGAVVYFGLLYILDKRFRALFGAFLSLI